MRSFTLILIAGFSLFAGIFYSCNKWVDPKPINDPRLINPYCNDPNAVNYNWGFPGKPDNTICYYPSDLFKGKFVFQDSVYSQSGSTFGLFLWAKTDTLSFYALSQTKIIASGICGITDSFKLTAYTFTATMDTLVGDTLTSARGQIMCRVQDTVSGTLFYNRTDSLIHISLQVINDTGISTHVGVARKL